MQEIKSRAGWRPSLVTREQIAEGCRRSWGNFTGKNSKNKRELRKETFQETFNRHQEQHIVKLS